MHRIYYYELMRQKNVKLSINDKLRLLINNSWFFFFFILLLSLYLRFWNIESVFMFGWDQARDAFEVKKILDGELTLLGPRTGVGHFHLGPLYYYLLVPFFFLTHFDPMASNYFNIVVNIFNFLVIFYVFKKIYSNQAALFSTFIYGVSEYIIKQNQIPWNVSLVPGISVLITYSLYKIYQKEYKWIFVLVVLTGFFFHIHFTAVFLPLIIILSLAFVKERIKIIKYLLLSLPLLFVFFLPTIFHYFRDTGDYIKLSEFLSNYYHGFHFRFLLYRLSDALLMFEMILYFPFLKLMKYLLPPIFLIIILLIEHNREKKILGWIMLMWFIGPLIGFTIYAGPISDYYFLLTIPAALYIIIYIQEQILKIAFKPFLFILIIFWTFYFYANTKTLWVKPSDGGLKAQKTSMKSAVDAKKVIPLDEKNPIYYYLYLHMIEEK